MTPEESLTKSLIKAQKILMTAIKDLEAALDPLVPLTNDESPQHLRDARAWYLGTTGRLRGLANELRTEPPFIGSLIIKMLKATFDSLNTKVPPDAGKLPSNAKPGRKSKRKPAAPDESGNNDRPDVRTSRAKTRTRRRAKGSAKPV